MNKNIRFIDKNKSYEEIQKDARKETFPFKLAMGVLVFFSVVMAIVAKDWGNILWPIIAGIWAYSSFMNQEMNYVSQHLLRAKLFKDLHASIFAEEKEDKK